MSHTTPLGEDPTAVDPAASSSAPVDVPALLARLEAIQAELESTKAALATTGDLTLAPAATSVPSAPAAKAPPGKPLPPFKPWKGIFWLIQKRLKGHAQHVAWAIALQTPENGTFPTRWQVLADFMGRAPSTVRDAAAEARDAGLLTWTSDNHGVVFTWTAAAYETKGLPETHRKRHTSAIPDAILTGIDALRDAVYRGFIAWHKREFGEKHGAHDPKLAQVAELPFLEFRNAGWLGVKSCDEATWERWTLAATTVAQALSPEEGAPLTDELVQQAVILICGARKEACPGLLAKKWPFGMFDAQDVERVIGPLTQSLARRRPKPPKAAEPEPPRAGAPVCGGAARNPCNGGRGCIDCRSYGPPPVYGPGAAINQPAA